MATKKSQNSKYFKIKLKYNMKSTSGISRFFFSDKDLFHFEKYNGKPCETYSLLLKGHEMHYHFLNKCYLQCTCCINVFALRVFKNQVYCRFYSSIFRGKLTHAYI